MKHILFLTWKDLRHPRAGWAERVMYEYAKRLVADGHRVTWFASGFPGAPSEETIDGIQVIRRYSIHTIYFFAWYWYRQFRKTHTVDIIVDEAGGIPLLSPLFEKKIPIYFFIHHIAEDEYRAAFPFPFNMLVKWFAYWAISLYKHFPTITVSDSTHEELQEKFHFTNVSVITNASDIIPISEIDFSSKTNTLVFLGRFVPVKRIEDVIRAFWYLHATHPSYVLQIIGRPQDKYYTQSLVYLVRNKGLDRSVQFVEYEKERIGEYLKKAKLMLVTSQKEGFWLVVLEANSFGLPVIAYDVPGLCDSVKDGINGYLVANGNYEAMWEKMRVVLRDPEEWQEISLSSLAYIQALGTWDEKYQEFISIIQV